MKYLLMKEVHADSLSGAEQLLWNEVGGIKEGWEIIHTHIDPWDDHEMAQLKLLIVIFRNKCEKLTRALGGNLVEEN